MGEITDFITLYIEGSDILEDKLDQIALKLNENIQNQLYFGHGRISSNLRDSIQTDYAIETPGVMGVVRGHITGTAEVYGWAVNDGYDEYDIYAKPKSALNTPYGLFKKVHHPGFEGLGFMESGLDATCALYR